MNRTTQIFILVALALSLLYAYLYTGGSSVGFEPVINAAGYQCSNAYRVAPERGSDLIKGWVGEIVSCPEGNYFVEIGGHVVVPHPR
jgi:hypothetical protein